MIKDALGDRMKGYEDISRIYLTKRMPLIIRIDGKAFHSFTRGFQRPFDRVLMNAMQETTLQLCKEISGCKLGYVQSDEISLLITDYDTLDTSPWFEKNLQKLVSVSASMATLYFNRAFDKFTDEFTEAWNIDQKVVDAYYKACDKGATFDARAFVLPKEEVCNYFIWRQQDASRNSIQMLARTHYSHKQLDRKKVNDLHDMLMEKGINWNDCEVDEKRGACVTKVEYDPRPAWTIDRRIPIFTQDRWYVNNLVFLDENKEETVG